MKTNDCLSAWGGWGVQHYFGVFVDGWDLFGKNNLEGSCNNRDEVTPKLWQLNAFIVECKPIFQTTLHFKFVWLYEKIRNDWKRNCSDLHWFFYKAKSKKKYGQVTVMKVVYKGKSQTSYPLLISHGTPIGVCGSLSRSRSRWPTNLTNHGFLDHKRNPNALNWSLEPGISRLYTCYTWDKHTIEIYWNLTFNELFPLTINSQEWSKYHDFCRYLQATQTQLSSIRG